MAQLRALGWAPQRMPIRLTVLGLQDSTSRMLLEVHADRRSCVGCKRSLARCRCAFSLPSGIAVPISQCDNAIVNINPRVSTAACQHLQRQKREEENQLRLKRQQIWDSVLHIAASRRREGGRRELQFNCARPGAARPRGPRPGASVAKPETQGGPVARRAPSAAFSRKRHPRGPRPKELS
jgi:hypothetical protein